MPDRPPRFSLPVPLGAPPTWDAAKIRVYDDHVRQMRAFLEDGTALATIEPDRLHILIALVEAMRDVHQTMSRVDRRNKLNAAYELFVCRLKEAGLPVRWESRKARALGHRRLGELAEGRGDVVAALWHYEQAVRSWHDVGCRRRRDQLEAAAR